LGFGVKITFTNKKTDWQCFISYKKTPNSPKLSTLPIFN